MDVLYKQLKSEAEEQRLKEFFLIRNVSKDKSEEDEGQRIKTTFIKTY